METIGQRRNREGITIMKERGGKSMTTFGERIKQLRPAWFLKNRAASGKVESRKHQPPFWDKSIKSSPGA